MTHGCIRAAEILPSGAYGASLFTGASSTPGDPTERARRPLLRFCHSCHGARPSGSYPNRLGPFSVGLFFSRAFLLGAVKFLRQQNVLLKINRVSVWLDESKLYDGNSVDVGHLTVCFFV